MHANINEKRKARVVLQTRQNSFQSKEYNQG